MELLRENEERGYPVEYLLSRLRARRTTLVRDWESLMSAPSLREYFSSSRYSGFMTDASSEGIWRRLIMEFAWVHSQMDSTLRKIFGPFFLYSELRTLFYCLRYKSAGEDTRVGQVLEHSLLSGNVQKTLKRGRDIMETIGDTEALFVSLSWKFGGIREIFIREGLKGVERFLTDSFIEYTVNSKLHPVIRDFFLRIIDARNLITLFKYLRWGVKEEPPFIEGGRISSARLRDVMDKDDIFGVLLLTRALTGLTVRGPDVSGLENSLYVWMTRELKRAGRDSDVGLILDYLWRCSIEARNLGILVHSGNMARDTVAEELIR